MTRLTPAFLLQNPELISPLAPWCVTLENLELGILLVAQPWLAAGGLRRAELERQLGRLGTHLPLGPLYYQRVKRAVARLEEIGAVRGAGGGRNQRFGVTPQGFAALILNLGVLSADPTLDGGEFELKRALVAMWNLALEQLGELPQEVPLSPDVEGFFDAVEGLRVLGEPVITPELVGETLDILGLIARQRRRVEGLLRGAQRRLEGAEAKADAVGDLDLSQLPGAGLAEAASLLGGAPDAVAVIREMATGVLPRLSLRASVLRYRHYLEYLDELASLHAGELKTVGLAAMRDLLAKRSS